MLCFQADSTVIEFKNLQCACQKHLTFRYLRQQLLQQLEEQKNQEDWELASESEEEGEEEERHDNEDQHEQQHDDEPSPVLKYVNYLNNHDLSLVPGKCSKTMSSLLTKLKVIYTIFLCKHRIYVVALAQATSNLSTFSYSVNIRPTMYATVRLMCIPVLL